MRRLITTLLVLAVLFVGVGFYLGWFHFDEKKFDEDKAKAVEKIKEETGKVKDTVHQGVDKVKDADGK